MPYAEISHNQKSILYSDQAQLQTDEVLGDTYSLSIDKPHLQSRQNHHIGDHDQGPGIGEGQNEHFFYQTYSSASMEIEGDKNCKVRRAQPSFQQEFNCELTTNELDREFVYQNFNKNKYNKSQNGAPERLLKERNGAPLAIVKVAQSIQEPSMSQQFNNEN